jgi:hypothetical protein
MIRPAVEVVLSLVDKISAPLRGTSQGVRGMFGDIAKSIVPIVNVGDIAAMAMRKLTDVVRGSFAAFDEYRTSQIKLEGTAKMTGVALSTLTSIAKEAEDRFRMSKTQSADFAVEVVKLATAAGDVGKAAPLLKAFLDIGAARGLTAEQTLKAVQQSILGIDEGTDKLFGKNPSGLWADYAKVLGVSAGKFGELEKNQALAYVTLEMGTKVVGTMETRLGETVGQLQATSNATQMFQTRLGELLDPVRRVTARIIEGFANIGMATIGTFEVIGTSALAIIQGTWNIVRGTLGGASSLLGTIINTAAKVAGPLRDEFEAVGQSLQSWGTGVFESSERNLTLIGSAWKTRMGEIYGISQQTESDIVAVQAAGSAQREEISAAEAARRKKDAEEAAKAFDAIATSFREAYDPDENPAITKARAAIEKINDALVTQKGLSAEQRTELQRIRQAYEDNIDSLEMGLGIERELVRVRDLPFQEDKLRSLNRLLEESIRFRDQEGQSAETVKFFTAQTEAIQKEIKAELGQNVQLQRSVADAARMTQYAYALMSGDVETLARMQREAAEAAGEGAGHVEKQQKEMYNAARGAVSLAKEMGVINAESAGVLNNVITLSETLKDGLSNLSAGGLIGAVGAVAGILGSIFSKNPAHEALMRRNNDALQALTRSNGLLLRAQSTGAQVEAAKGALPGLESLTFGGSGAIDATRFQGFRATLQAQGLTITDAEQLAKDMGVDLGIENGRISKEAIEAFVRGLKTANFGSFEDSFGGFLDELDFQSGLVGGFSPTEQLNRIKEGLGKDFGSSALSGAFGGVDLTTAEGRATLMQRLLGIGQNIGSLTDGERGGLTGSEFTDILTRITGILRDMETAPPGGAPAGGTAPDTGASAVPTTGGVAVPGAPAGLNAGIPVGDSGLMISHLGKLVEQGTAMISLQTRIAVATEAAVGRPSVAIGTINASTVDAVEGAVIKGLDEALRIERDLGVLTRGG